MTSGKMVLMENAPMLRQDWEASIPRQYPETHIHRFTRGESTAEREAWLAAQMHKAGLTRTELFCRATDEGYVFGFKSFEHYAAFYLNAFGDPQTNRGQVTDHSFGGQPDRYWIRAAQMYLDHLGIHYDMEVNGDTVSFAFDRFSECATLRLLADHGHIEQTARALERSDQVMDFVRRSHPGPEGPGFAG